MSQTKDSCKKILTSIISIEDFCELGKLLTAFFFNLDRIIWKVFFKNSHSLHKNLSQWALKQVAQGRQQFLYIPLLLSKNSNINDEAWKILVTACKTSISGVIWIRKARLISSLSLRYAIRWEQMGKYTIKAVISFNLLTASSPITPINSAKCLTYWSLMEAEWGDDSIMQLLFLITFVGRECEELF